MISMKLKTAYLNLIFESAFQDNLISFFKNSNNFKKLLKSNKMTSEKHEIIESLYKLFETDKESAIKSALEWKKLEKDNTKSILFDIQRRTYNKCECYWYSPSSGKIDSHYLNYDGQTAAIVNSMFSSEKPIEFIYNTAMKYGAWL